MQIVSTGMQIVSGKSNEKYFKVLSPENFTQSANC